MNDFSDLTTKQIKKMNEVIKEVMDDAMYLKAKQVYSTFYFWLKDNSKFSAIHEASYDALVAEVQKQARIYLKY